MPYQVQNPQIQKGWVYKFKNIDNNLRSQLVTLGQDWAADIRWNDQFTRDNTEQSKLLFLDDTSINNDGIRVFNNVNSFLIRSMKLYRGSIRVILLEEAHIDTGLIELVEVNLALPGQSGGATSSSRRTPKKRKGKKQAKKKKKQSKKKMRHK